MAGNRMKRKAWVYCKKVNILRTTARRSKTVGQENTDSVFTPDSMIARSPMDTSTQFSCGVFNNVPCLNYYENDPSSDDPVDESLTFLINMESNSVTCSDESPSSSEESESETERSDSGSDSECDSEHNNETSNLETNDEDIRDDSIPLYNDARVSRLGALILVMLFSLRHQLSGKALIDLVKVLRALLLDGHKFIASAYLLKKYFADLFGEPAPIRHSNCGNCLGRIRNGQAQCLKANCENSKKKTEYFLELDLQKRLCQLYRGMKST
ncbi:uncharacterized protein LOC111320995 [Stylophora pistillata]|uniref:uncharacterized protein LOC111320995 n=1 Tax=Stylophora pistillata TaxID=50429 RepID=UPI000C051C14|nr:uncharacterized protein LOC111320995 [Stylophora pistillata]